MNFNFESYTNETFQEPFERCVSEEEVDYAIDYITTNPSSIWTTTFSERLTGYLIQLGYTGDEDDVDGRVDFLYQRYQSIPAISITKATLANWFSGKNRPLFDIRARERMYELCYVLGLSYDEVCHFFSHIYLDRCFNCRDFREAVYCYCFSNHLDYCHTLLVLEQVKDLFAKPNHSDIKDTDQIHHNQNAGKTIYTSAITDTIHSITDDRKFLAYICQHKDYFLEYNVSGRKHLKELMEQIKGSNKDRELVNQLRKDRNDKAHLHLKTSDFDGYSLKEWYHSYSYYDSSKDMLEEIKGLDVTSDTFMLYRIFDANLNRIYEDSSAFLETLTQIARINFPSKQILWNILNAVSQDSKNKPSFDAIRKMLILLHFYKFSVEYTLETDFIGKQTEVNFFNDYIIDANDLLSTVCGYPSLYIGNPYDLIFLFSARTKQPLDTFRDIINGLIERDLLPSQFQNGNTSL